MSDINRRNWLRLLGASTVSIGSFSAETTGQTTPQAGISSGKPEPPSTVVTDPTEQTEVTINRETDTEQQPITTADNGVSIAWRDPLSSVGKSSQGPGTDTFSVTPNLVIGGSLTIGPDTETTFRFINETEGLSLAATLTPDEQRVFRDRLQVTLIDTDGSITEDPYVRFVLEDGDAVQISCTISGDTDTFAANPVASYTAELIENNTVQATAAPDRLFIGYTPAPETRINGEQFETSFDADGMPPRTDIQLELYDPQATDETDADPTLVLSSTYNETEDQFDFETNSLDFSIDSTRFIVTLDEETLWSGSFISDITIRDFTVSGTLTGNFDSTVGEIFVPDSAQVTQELTDNGKFEIRLPKESGPHSINIAYIEANTDGAYGVLNQNPDLYHIDYLPEITDDISLGTVEIPEAHDLTVTVVDGSGNPLENITTWVRSLERNPVVPQSPGWYGFYRSTNAEGEFKINDSQQGIEIAGGAEIAIGPRQNSSDDRVPDVEKTTRVTVTGDQEVVVEVNPVTVTGRVEYPDGTAASGDTIVGFTGQANGSVRVADDGTFSLSLPRFDQPDNEFPQLGYYKDGVITDSPTGPTDGITDLYALATPDGTTDQDIGTTSIPSGFLSAVSVSDMRGEPVGEVNVEYRDIGEGGKVATAATTDTRGKTRFDGQDGIELSGRVKFIAQPPSDRTDLTDQDVIYSTSVTEQIDPTIVLPDGNSSMTLDNVGSRAWEITDLSGGEIAAQPNTENPTIELTTGIRYEITNNGGETHPLEFRGQDGTVLLSQTQTGSFADDPAVAWNDTGDTVTFTCTESLAQSLSTYVCTNHQSMEGTIGIDVRSDDPDSSPPAISDGVPPTDVDGDGLYEDIDGDGTFDIFDIQTLYTNLDTAAVQENAGAYNFSGDDSGEVTIFDVQALYDKLNR